MRFHRHFSSLLCVGALATSLGACGSTLKGQPTATPSAPLPPYDEQAARLFDDRIDGNAVGLADVTDNPRIDPTFRARAQSSDLIARVRVLTVTSDTVSDGPLYRVNLTFAAAPLIQRGIKDDHIEISVRSTSAAFGVVKWLDAGLIGRTFVGFFRRYADGESLEPKLRFHLAADTPSVLTAAHEADMLRELSGDK
ncbi:MAG TPA: cobalamin ABC transporter substrate-binding protein [Polyangiaceae bacterium]